MTRKRNLKPDAPNTALTRAIIRWLDEDAGRSATMLSGLVGRNEKLVQQILEGKSRSPQTKTLVGLSRALGIPIAELAEGEPKRSEPDIATASYYERLAHRLGLAVQSVAGTTEEIAEAIGITPDALLQLQAGHRRPDLLTIAKLCERFRIPPGWLILGDESYLDLNLAARLARAEADTQAEGGA